MADELRTTVSIKVDGRTIEAQPGELVIAAAERAGTYVPRFCYHPRMEPVGVCRMCLVEVDGPRGATLQPACYLRVSEGMTVTTDSPKVKKAQDGVLEFLLANHPLDCPVCDKGGECPLQDQTLAHGSGETRFIEEKRHYAKPVSIGENVLLDRERCIQCSRCTRFASEVAGEAQIDFSGRGDLIEVAPAPTDPFDSVFSGNTVQICPVGALTAKPYRFKARPWDLDQAETTCTTCAVGCREVVQASGNRLTRVLGLDSEAVNHGWLCDKGRFTLDAVDGNEESVDVLKTATRIREPLVREKGKLVPTNWGTALARASEILLSAASSADGVGAIGGASLTNEGAFAWERYVRGVLGSNNLDAQFGDGLDGALMRALPAATIDQVSRASTIVTLCGDLRDELPVLYLRLRENLTKRKAALVEFRQAPSHLTPLATKSIPVLPGEVHQVVADFVNATKSDEHYAARTLVGETGAGVVFVVGRMNVGESPRYLETAIRQLAERFPEATFLSALRRSNVHGALDMGLDPRLVPGRRLAEVTGRSSLEQFEAMRNGEQKAVLLLGGCVLGNVVDVDGAKLALSKASVVAVTGHGGATLEYADVVLPALVQHERVGTFTNLEGRLSALQAKVSPAGSAWSDVAIASELAEESGQNLGLSSVEHAAQTIEATTGYPTWRVLSAPSNDGLLASDAGSPLPSAPLDPTAIPGVQSVSTVGIGAGVGATAVESVSAGAVFAPLSLSALGELSVPKKPARSVKALRVVATRALYDDGIAVTASPALQGVREEAVAHVSAATAKKFGIADHGRVTLRSSVSSQAVATAIADGVTDGTVWIRYGERSADGRDAIRPLLVGDDVITVEVEA